MNAGHDFGEVVTDLLKQGNDDEVVAEWLRDEYGEDALALMVARIRVLGISITDRLRCAYVAAHPKGGNDTEHDDAIEACGLIEEVLGDLGYPFSEYPIEEKDGGGA